MWPELKPLFVLLIVFCVTLTARSQDTLPATGKITALPDRFLSAVDSKTTSLEDKLTRQTDKYLNRLARQEDKLKRKLSRTDSTVAKKIFDKSAQKYQQLAAKMKAKTSGVENALSGGNDYLPNVDSLTTSLNFLSQNGNNLLSGNEQAKQVKDVLNNVKALDGKMQEAEEIKTYIRERKQQLRDQLSQYGMGKDLAKYNKEAYYYAAQVKEYKNMWNDPEKVQQKAMELLNKLPVFQKFVQQHSQLSGLFASPGSFSSLPSGASMPIVNGIAPRASVQQVLQASMPTAGANTSLPQLMQQQIGNARTEIKNLMDKVNTAGGLGDKDVPDFKPNSQRTKSFGKRLEYGGNFQFDRSTNFLPAGCDIGLQLGYKFSDKTSAGIGAAYKLGLGTGWKDLHLSSESIGFRTYLKTKIKGSFSIQGGAEWNYMTSFSKIEELKNLRAWQTSALLGVVKSYKINKKVNGNVQLLYDFLHNQHVPASQPVLFRVGYNF
jgi:hypothetical protein